MESDGLKKKTITSLFWKLFEKGGSAVVSLFVQIVMARLLTPEDFGALSVLLVFINIGNVVVQSGLNTAIVQARHISETDLSTVFWLCFAVSGVLYLIVYFAAPFISTVYSMNGLVGPLRALALVFFINALNSIQIAIIQRNLEFYKFFFATVFSVVVSASLGIGLAIYGFGLWALVIQQLSYQIANCLAHAAQLSWRPKFAFDFFRARSLFKYGSKLLASGLLDQVYQSLSDLIIGRQFSSRDLGFVSQGKKYPLAIGSMLDGSIQPVMLSAVSRLQDDKNRVKQLVRRALKTSTFIIVPAMTLFAIAANPLVNLLLGEKWLPCVPFLQMYCFVYALLPIHTTNLQALNGVGRSDLFLKLELIKKAYGICFMLFSAFVFKNVYLMIASYMVTGVISTFVNAWPNKTVIGYSYLEQLRDIIPAFLLSAISGFFAWCITLFSLSAAVTILLQLIVMMIVYLGVAWLLHVEEFDYLLAIVREVLDRI